MTRSRRSGSACALVSGGLDSAALAAYLLRRGCRVRPLYVRCGLRWEAVEQYWLARFLATLPRERRLPLRVVRWPVRELYGAHWSLTGRAVPGSRSPDRAVELPLRNVILLSAAAAVCAQEGHDTIAVGTLAANPFADASPAFFRKFAAAVSEAAGRPVRIVAPFRCLKKAALIRSGRALRLDLTFSCLAPSGRQACGCCNKCAERRLAFHRAGVPDPTRYANRKGAR